MPEGTVRPGTGPESSVPPAASAFRGAPLRGAGAEGGRGHEVPHVPGAPLAVRCRRAQYGPVRARRAACRQRRQPSAERRSAAWERKAAGGVRFPELVTLVEVAPRDGLQSLARTYPTEVKVELVELL